MSAKEFAIIKRMVWVGYRDEEIGDIVGRTTSSVRCLRAYYGFERETQPRSPSCKFPVEKDREINAKIRDWIQVQRLTATRMAELIKVMYPPGLHLTAVLNRIHEIDPTGNLWREYKRNDSERRSRVMQRRCMGRRAQLQNGADTCADQQTQAGRV